MDTVVLTGTTTPNCIRTTCYDAISLDYKVTVLEDCCSSNTEDIQQANMRDMSNVGAEILSSAAFLQTLDDGQLSIRPVRPEDLDRCAAIEAACFPKEQAASHPGPHRRLCELFPGRRTERDYHRLCRGASHPRGIHRRRNVQRHQLPQ